MRPDSIRKFDLFYLAAIAISLASSLLNYDTQVALLTARLAGQPTQDYAEAIVLLSTGIALGFYLLLWFLASRLRLGWTRWIVLLMVLYSLASVVVGLGMGAASVSITGLVTLLLKAIATYFLFQKDTLQWLKRSAE